MGAGRDAGLGGMPGAAVGPRGTHELLTFVQAAAEMLNGGERSWRTPPRQDASMGKGRKKRGGRLGVKDELKRARERGESQSPRPSLSSNAALRRGATSCVSQARGRTQTDAPGVGKQPDPIPRDVPWQQARRRWPAPLAHPPVKIFST